MQRYSFPVSLTHQWVKSALARYVHSSRRGGQSRTMNASENLIKATCLGTAHTCDSSLEEEHKFGASLGSAEWALTSKTPNKQKSPILQPRKNWSARWKEALKTCEHKIVVMGQIWARKTSWRWHVIPTFTRYASQMDTELGNYISGSLFTLKIEVISLRGS